MIQVFYGCHMMLVENIEQGGVDPGPSAATQALASTLVDALSERNYKVFFPSEKTPDPVRNRRVFAPETMQIEAVNLRCWNVCSTFDKCHYYFAKNEDVFVKMCYLPTSVLFFLIFVE